MSNGYTADQVVFTRLKAVSKDIVYVGSNPKNQELGAKFTAICQYIDGSWCYETFPFALSSLALCQTPGDEGRIIYILFETGEVINFHTKKIEIVVPKNSPLKINHRLGYLLKIRQLGDSLYVCGAGGQVYRRSTDENWVAVQEGMFDGRDQMLDSSSEFYKFSAELLSNPNATSADFQKYQRLLLRNQSNTLWDIAGFSENDFYVCSEKSIVCWFNGEKFTEIATGSSKSLLSILPENQERVWVCGREGTLLVGNHSRGFSQVSGLRAKPYFSSMALFMNKLYIGSYANPRGLFVYDGRVFQRVSLGMEPDEEDVSMIESIDGVLWVMGSRNILRYDGDRWERIPFPA